MEALRSIKRRVLGSAHSSGYCPSCMDPTDVVDRFRWNIRKEPDTARRELVRMLGAGILSASLPLLLRSQISLQACAPPPTQPPPQTPTVQSWIVLRGTIQGPLPPQEVDGEYSFPVAVEEVVDCDPAFADSYRFRFEKTVLLVQSKDLNRLSQFSVGDRVEVYGEVVYKAVGDVVFVYVSLTRPEHYIRRIG